MSWPYTHEYGITQWTVVDPPGATPFKTKKHQTQNLTLPASMLSVVNNSSVRDAGSQLTRIQAETLSGLFLCRSVQAAVVHQFSGPANPKDTV